MLEDWNGHLGSMGLLSLVTTNDQRRDCSIQRISGVLEGELLSQTRDLIRKP